MTDPLLSIRELRVRFDTDEGVVQAVDGVSFDVERGETVCVVGESGSGKTVACESVTRLIPMPPGEIAGGEILFDGEDLTEASEKRLESIRGGRIAHVFQNPQSALNPVYPIGAQIVEAIRLHRDVSKQAARDRAIDLLDRVGIPEATARVDDYPHEFSGGMKQRVVIAMALAADPDLLVADEPTTALDVTIQAQILRLLRDLQAEFGMSIVFVTHDLGVVAEIADRVVVMYAGRVMETGSVHDVFDRPSHPYTKALLDCLPGQGQSMRPIGGTLPDLKQPPAGCRFHPRCPHATADCRTGTHPELLPVGSGHDAACVYYGPGYDSTVIRGESVSESRAADGGDAVADSDSDHDTTGGDC
ncbi:MULTISPECIES: ABC transporter ATP-binding protein [Haloferax]|uniref:Nickel import system ATP-binding protein NikD n=1 Tax=Haloferax marinum TaxID=2666143 RepID=A0A6A8G448_9EURY|nr:MULTISPECIES: ABC transporter ATP-binding protein [Haloferax]KAB1196702.1 ABC transporter ATP-binding protein [Haloferax sp. CBA1150]MRW95709.1 ATP-binding cassette domain-containing protein [Haloferax marinum]